MIVNCGAVRVESGRFARALVPGAKYRDKSLPADETENPRDAADGRPPATDPRGSAGAGKQLPFRQSCASSTDRLKSLRTKSGGSVSEAILEAILKEMADGKVKSGQEPASKGRESRRDSAPSRLAPGRRFP
jgi:hypothetical protein